MQVYYVIEHFSHGMYVGIDWSASGNSYGPRFRYSIKRSDGKHFDTLTDAMTEIKMIQSYTHPYWNRQKWIDQIMPYKIEIGR